MHTTRIFISVLSALLAPALALAQDTSTGAVTLQADTGAILGERLRTIRNGGVELTTLSIERSTRDAWRTETKRHADRRAELRSRCREEIRKANRDSIVEKSAQCLRADLLLETTLRRKQRDSLKNAAGADPSTIDETSAAVNAWIDASTAVTDGVDAKVFVTLDMLKQAKRNLHDTYRIPMLHAFVRVRASNALAVARSVAQSIGDVPADQHAVDEAIVACMETAVRTLEEASVTGASMHLHAGLDNLRACIDSFAN